MRKTEKPRFGARRFLLPAASLGLALSVQSATPARYVRLTYADHHSDALGYTPTFAFTTEVEVFGPAL